MRNPVRSETDAFRIAFGGAVLIGASAALAAAASPVAGAALLGGAAAGAFVWQVATKDPDRQRPLRDAASSGRRSVGGRPQVLVVANRTLADQELRREMRERAAAGSEIRILVPILVSRARYIASDVDRELGQARRRLAETLAWAAAEGIAASGTVGDPNAAFQAIEDELRLAGAEEVILSTLPRGKSNWLEAGILGRLRDELDIPVTHLVGSADGTAPGDPPARRPRRDPSH